MNREKKTYEQKKEKSRWREIVRRTMTKRKKGKTNTNIEDQSRIKQQNRRTERQKYRKKERQNDQP